jgi:hypothetical protein
MCSFHKMPTASLRFWLNKKWSMRSVSVLKFSGHILSMGNRRTPIGRDWLVKIGFWIRTKRTSPIRSQEQPKSGEITLPH